MTREEAKEVFLNRGFIDGIYDGDKWREACIVISKWLEQEPTTKNDLGVNCISRVQTQTEIEMNASRYTIAKERGGMGQVEWSDQLIKVSDAIDIIRNLPSVTPQEPKTGHWIVQPSNKEQGERDFIWWKCSECGQVIFSETEHDRLEFHAFCGRCGADMRGEEE